MEIIEKVTNLIEEAIANEGYALKKVIYEKEDGLNFLRIMIDKDPFVEIEDCVVVSKLINPILDTKDLIEEQYILDVCSYERGQE